MEQQEQRWREMKINLSINQQQQQKEAVKTKREDNANIRIGEDQELIGRDLWKQLRRVSIPIFDGNKSTYESWKAAFTAFFGGTLMKRSLQLSMNSPASCLE